MPIENRNMEPGTRLMARYKKEDRSCEVVETADGLRYRLDDGTEHKSPSSAGKAVTGIACNGWVFWRVAGTEKPKREARARAEKPSQKKAVVARKPAKPKNGRTKSAKKGKAHRVAPKNDASFGSGACPETFPTMEDATTHALAHTG